jgi:hypothetical protein
MNVRSLRLSLGPDYAKYAIRSDSTNDNNEPIDEIDEFWNARYLTAGEAAYRILGYHISKKEPAVTGLPVHLPDCMSHQRYHHSQNALSPLLRYFVRPQGFFQLNGVEHSFDELTYNEYYQLFRLTPYRAQYDSKQNYFRESPHTSSQMHVILRTSHEHISRLHVVNPSKGELFYLRALLQHRCSRSFLELYTVDGEVCTSFQEAASRLGLFADDNEATYAMSEAVHTLRTPRQLRMLFVHLLVNDCVPLPLDVWSMFQAQLIQDFEIHRNGSVDLAVNDALIAIGSSLEEHGRTLDDFGLPQPTIFSSEVEHELERWGAMSRDLNERASRNERRLNPEQRVIYEDIVNTILNEEQGLWFIDGKAGRGKTFLIRCLCDRLRSLKHIVLATATTAFAALQYDGGRTTHSTFKVWSICYNTCARLFRISHYSGSRK